MKEIINQEVSVVMYYSAAKKRALPRLVHWQNKEYHVDKLGYYHNYMEGSERQHIYEFTDSQQALWFRLRLNSSNLHWTLEAIHDGLPD